MRITQAAKKLTILWHFCAACVIWSKLSTGIPVRRPSSVSLGLRISTKSSNSCGIGVDTPPTSRMTGTLALLAACNFKRITKDAENYYGKTNRVIKSYLRNVSHDKNVSKYEMTELHYYRMLQLETAAKLTIKQVPSVRMLMTLNLIYEWK